MSEFVRVRSASPNDPQHEFHAAAAEVEANPDLYEVIDPEPVSAPEPPLYVTGSEDAPQRASRGSKKSTAPAATPTTTVAPTEPVGDTDKEND